MELPRSCYRLGRLSLDECPDLSFAAPSLRRALQVIARVMRAQVELTP